MKTIVYIEDNPMNFNLVEKILRKEGYEVIPASTGLGGLDEIERVQPVAVLLDINLPDIDGTEVARRLRSNPQTHHIPIVALTANTMAGDRENYLQVGCDGYLAKPITRIELLYALKQAIG